MSGSDRSYVSIHEIADSGLEGKTGLVADFDYPEKTEPAEDARAVLLAGLLQQILPGENVPGPKRFEAGYRRFVVLVWMVAPDVVVARTVKELAEELGCTEWNIYKIRDDLREIMGVQL